MARLAFQHNDAVEDEDDARDKYFVRQLFRNLATENCLMPELSGTGGLFLEDFRPANFVLNEDLQVVGVIDREFAYAAPVQCSFGPPALVVASSRAGALDWRIPRFDEGLRA